jgi:hypothetical protein
LAAINDPKEDIPADAVGAEEMYAAWGRQTSHQVGFICPAFRKDDRPTNDKDQQQNGANSAKYSHTVPAEAPPHQLAGGKSCFAFSPDEFNGRNRRFNNIKINSHKISPSPGGYGGRRLCTAGQQ